MPANTPEEVDALFERHINAGDAEAVAALYEPDGVLMPQPGQVAAGSAAVLEALKGLVAAKPRIKMNVVNVVTAGDVAVLYNDWSGTVSGPDGQDVSITGKAIEIVRRQPDGTWLFVIDDPYARGS